jgi:hypothetical protein
MVPKLMVPQTNSQTLGSMFVVHKSSRSLFSCDHRRLLTTILATNITLVDNLTLRTVSNYVRCLQQPSLAFQL